MASSIPDARANLYAGLAALTWPAPASGPAVSVGVYRTGLWREEKAPDRVIVADAADVEREVMALGRPAPFREEFALNVQFEVYRSGDDIGFVEDRLWALITAVEQYVMADPTLGGAVSQALPSGIPNPQSGPSSADEDTLLAVATLRLDCWARVHLN